MAKILHVIPAFLPAIAWGGPVFSTSAICKAASEAGHQVTVITTNSSDPNTSQNLNIKENKAHFSEGYEVIYMPRTFGQSGSWKLLYKLPSMIKNSDIIHLSMTYSFPTIPTLLFSRIYGKPIIWSPRGAIQATNEWKKTPNRVFKKLFTKLSKLLISKNNIIHVTALSEKLSTEISLANLNFTIIPNAVKVPKKLISRSWKPDGRFRMLFLSRLHPKKGLELLFEALSELPEDINLIVAGSGSKEYEKFLKNKISQLSIESRVEFLGNVSGKEKENIFQKSDLFVLPSYSENFGIVIAEALANGLPVITTRYTPWEGLVDNECGWWINPDKISITESIIKAYNLSRGDLSDMGRKGHNWILKDFSYETVNKQFVQLYQDMLNKKK